MLDRGQIGIVRPPRGRGKLKRILKYWDRSWLHLGYSNRTEMTNHVRGLDLQEMRIVIGDK